MLLRVLWICVLGILPACRHTKHRKPVSQASFAGSIYQVKKGDTVHSIAKQKHVSAFDLMEVNGITDSKELRVGQNLYVPEAELDLAMMPTAKTQNLPHVIKPALDGRKINLVWPVKNGVLFRSFDTNAANLHEGISLAAPRGTPVCSAAEGEVIYVGDDEARYGRIVIIKHEDPFVTIYTHLAHIDVMKGQKVKQKEEIGTVGTSGGIDSPRLYFQVRQNRTPVDPELYLKHAHL